MSRRARRWLLCWLFLWAATPACQTHPPVLTGVTLSPAADDGSPDPIIVARTRIEPPIPLIGVRPGADPLRGGLFMNQPETGTVAVTLGRGEQSFLLFTLAQEERAHYVIGLFLDDEATPALSAMVARGVSAPLQPSTAPTIMGLNGTAVANTSTLSVDRRGYRVTLRWARFPISDLRIDAAGPWRLGPDNVADAVGVISLDVRPVVAVL